MVGVMSSTHSVTDFAHGLGGKLASRSRHVCVFLGAGASRAAGLPDLAGLEKAVKTGLPAEQRTRWEQQVTGRSLEQALSRVRRIAALAGGPPGFEGMTGAEAEQLDAAVCAEVVTALDSTSANLGPALRLASWAARAQYHLPVELFTVNYDLLVEQALESLSVPYFDGFVGTIAGRFRTDLVEAQPDAEDGWLPAFIVRLWKLHGSVNWQWEAPDRRQVLRLGGPVPAGHAAAIYPSDAKYEESRRVPFVVLQDRLRRALDHPETLVLVSGYSFGDEHLNEMLFDAAARRPRTEIAARCYCQPADELLERAERTPNLQVTWPEGAVLGGLRGEWEDPGDGVPADLWNGDRFALGDFAAFASFLARSSPPDGDLDRRLAERVSGGGAGA